MLKIDIEKNPIEVKAHPSDLDCANRHGRMQRLKIVWIQKQIISRYKNAVSDAPLGRLAEADLVSDAEIKCKRNETE